MDTLTPGNVESYKAKIAKLEKEIETLRRKQTEKMKMTKYGLNWVDVPEAFEKNAENKIPVLKEGDNYHALQCLNYTHLEENADAR